MDKIVSKKRRHWFKSLLVTTTIVGGLVLVGLPQQAKADPSREQTLILQNSGDAVQEALDAAKAEIDRINQNMQANGGNGNINLVPQDVPFKDSNGKVPTPDTLPEVVERIVSGNDDMIDELNETARRMQLEYAQYTYDRELAKKPMITDITPGSNVGDLWTKENIWNFLGREFSAEDAQTELNKPLPGVGMVDDSGVQPLLNTDEPKDEWQILHKKPGHETDYADASNTQWTQFKQKATEAYSATTLLKVRQSPDVEVNFGEPGSYTPVPLLPDRAAYLTPTEGMNWTYTNALEAKVKGVDGKYHDQILDVRVTLDSFTLYRNATNPKICVNGNNYGFYVNSSTFHKFTTKVEYFEAGTRNPVEIKALLGICDIDLGQGLSVDTPYDSVLYATRNPVIPGNPTANNIRDKRGQVVYTTTNATGNDKVFTNEGRTEDDDAEGTAWFMMKPASSMSYTYYTDVHEQSDWGRRDSDQYVGGIPFDGPDEIKQAPEPDLPDVQFGNPVLLDRTTYTVKYRGAGAATPPDKKIEVDWKWIYQKANPSAGTPSVSKWQPQGETDLSLAANVPTLPGFKVHVSGTLGDKKHLNQANAADEIDYDPVNYELAVYYSPVDNKYTVPKKDNDTPTPPETTPDTDTNPETPDKPTTNHRVPKGEAIYNVNKIGLYKRANFSKANRIRSYAKRIRINRYEFIVKGYARSSKGALRYYVQQYNPYKNKYIPGTKGYITASRKYVIPVYYKTTGTKRVKVINPRGVKAYTNKQLTNYQRFYKKGKTLNVARVVRQKYTTRFQLTNGLYITANKKFVIFTNAAS